MKLKIQDAIINLRQAAQISGRSVKNIREHCLAKNIPAFKQNNMWHMWRSDFIDWMRNNPKHNYKIEITPEEIENADTFTELAIEKGVSRENISYHAAKHGLGRGNG